MKARIKSGTVPEYLTQDKWYQVISVAQSMPQTGHLFSISDDDDDVRICLEKGCLHLECGDWELAS